MKVRPSVPHDAANRATGSGTCAAVGGGRRGDNCTQRLRALLFSVIGALKSKLNFAPNRRPRECPPHFAAYSLGFASGARGNRPRRDIVVRQMHRKPLNPSAIIGRTDSQ
jgi:hypothetical protein